MKNIFLKAIDILTKKRINRLEYLVYNIAIYAAIAIIVWALKLTGNQFINKYIILIFPLIWIYLFGSFSVKRFHDLGVPGYSAFLLLLPVFNLFILFSLLTRKGDIGSNDYGNESDGVFKMKDF